MADWTAEARVGEELARELVAEQFPPLPRRSVDLISEGWDYVVHLVDDEWAFRFPRRAVVVSGTERKIAVLGLLAPHLPVRVPAPVHIGQPTDRYPWPFFGARFLPGVEAGEASLSDDERAQMARPLARALRALRDPAVFAELGGAPAVRPDSPRRHGPPRPAYPCRARRSWRARHLATSARARRAAAARGRAAAA